MTQYDQLDCKNLECIVCQKHTKKELYFALSMQVRPITKLASSWLAYYNLCRNSFHFTADQIHLPLLRPCKIWHRLKCLHVLCYINFWPDVPPNAVV